MGAPFEVHYDGQTTHMRTVLAGLMRPGVPAPVLVLHPQQQSLYVDLSPTAMQRLTGAPLSELDAGGVTADSLLPWVSSLGEELAEQSHGRRETLMRARLLESLDNAGRVPWPSDSVAALTLIKRSRGQVSVEDVARQAHLSPRRLRHVMRRELGVTPKFAARAARLASAVDRAAHGAESWAQVAAETGFHDQSHLVHEFQAMMRTTPDAWVAEEGRNLQGWRRPAA
ncbi:AraC-like DNA-binding protein [Lipingzhangella halophila]|uniref:AraC-like DNA-binding protein n=1 Tax=Lipingzhangella halophila TaxID=1783352 RepID=A0A7W7RN14_9ACTN|nr:helix-turn-helix domain-containing protein [Lipingzhangella halophila]MBB4934984.1 AraC-like DNA-binding protein [Lipingzhangella halophila]